MVTPADVRRELAVTAAAVGLSDSEFDGLLSDVIARETERVEDAIDVRLGTETVTEATSRPASVAGPLLPLSKRPVQSVVDVTIDTDRTGGVAVTAADYVVEDTHLELDPEADRDAWPDARRSITVEYTHGYPDGDEPAPVNGAIIGLVRQAIQEIEADGIGQESIGSQLVNYELADDVVMRHLYRAQRFDEPDFYGGAQVI